MPVAAGLLLLLLGGCGSIHYQPDNTLPVELAREFSSTSMVNLINGQPSTEEINFSRRFTANLNAWTDVAISIADRELRKRGLGIRRDASKAITMAIESAKTDVGWVMITSTITMRVTTSSGYSATYTGVDMSGGIGNPRSQMNTAMGRVVGEMLSDPQLVDFLKNGLISPRGSQ
jgi:hypothetical protein